MSTDKKQGIENGWARKIVIVTLVLIVGGKLFEVLQPKWSASRATATASAKAEVGLPTKDNPLKVKAGKTSEWMPVVGYTLYCLPNTMKAKWETKDFDGKIAETRLQSTQNSHHDMRQFMRFTPDVDSVCWVEKNP